MHPIQEKPLIHENNKYDNDKQIVEENINNVSNAINEEETYENKSYIMTEIESE